MFFHILYIYSLREEYVFREITKDEINGKPSEGSDKLPTEPLYLTANTDSINDDLKFSPGLTDNGRWFVDRGTDDNNNNFVAIHVYKIPTAFLSVDGDKESVLVGLVQNKDTPENVNKNAIWEIVAYDKESNVVDPKIHGLDSDTIKFHKIKLENTDLCLSSHTSEPHVERCEIGDTDQMFKVSKFEPEQQGGDSGDDGNGNPDETRGNDAGKSGLNSNGSNNDNGKNNGIGGSLSLSGGKNQSQNGPENNQNGNDKDRGGLSGSLSFNGALSRGNNGNPENPISKSEKPYAEVIKSEDRPKSSSVAIGGFKPSSRPTSKPEESTRLEGGTDEKNITIQTEKVPSSFMSSSLVKTSSEVLHVVHSCTTTETVHITSTINTTKTSIVLITSTTIIELTKTVSQTESTSLSVTPVVVTSTISSTVLSTVPVEITKKPKEPKDGEELPDCPETPIPAKKPRKKNEFTKALGGVHKHKPHSILEDLNSDSSSESESNECENLGNMYKSLEKYKDSTINNIQDDLDIPGFMNEFAQVGKHAKKGPKHHKHQTSVCTTTATDHSPVKYTVQTTTPQQQQYVYYPSVPQQLTGQQNYYQQPVQPQAQVQQGSALGYASVSCNPIAVC